MENQNKFNFHGEGSKLFGIEIVNAILTVLTLGLYYPWAKAKKMHYLYEETEFAGSRFTFHGTGKEMFRGYIKAVALFAVLAGVMAYISSQNNIALSITGLLVIYAIIFALIPIAIHGSYKYRMSRTSWRSIHFGYHGELGELYKEFFTGLIITICTMGIYASWFEMNLRKYIISRIRFGSVKLDYAGNGTDFFILNLKGILLSYITLGIYFFWYQADLLKFYINNIKIYQNDKEINANINVSGGGVFGLTFVNILIVVFTLGLGAPWATVRTLNFILKNIEIGEEFNPNAILQTEKEYKNATGEELADVLDLGVI